MKLICPICGNPLTKENRSFICPSGHSFDCAKQGYVNLLIRQSKDHGDNKEMVQARTSFLNTDSYAFLRNRLHEIVDRYHPSVFADLGCGEGYYTSLMQAEEKYGFDMSKDALKHASSIDKITQYVVSSIFRLPLEDESTDCVLTCFAPAATKEIVRILKDHGIFIFVTPGPKHLYQLKEYLYEQPYENEMKDLDIVMKLISDEIIENTFTLNKEQLRNLFMMTPYYRRTNDEDTKKLDRCESMTNLAQFRIRIYQKTI